jgi:hypothetical protein
MHTHTRQHTHVDVHVANQDDCTAVARNGVPGEALQASAGRMRVCRSCSWSERSNMMQSREWILNWVGLRECLSAIPRLLEPAGSTPENTKAHSFQDPGLLTQVCVIGPGILREEALPATIATTPSIQCPTYASTTNQYQHGTLDKAVPPDANNPARHTAVPHWPVLLTDAMLQLQCHAHTHFFTLVQHAACSRSCQWLIQP